MNSTFKYTTYRGKDGLWWFKSGTFRYGPYEKLESSWAAEEDFVVNPQTYAKLAVFDGTANDFQKECLRTEDTPLFMLENGTPSKKFSRLMHAVLGLQTESAELADMLKKHLAYGKPFDTVNVLEEIGDVLWYAALGLDACGYDFQETMERIVKKLQIRYPNGFTSKNSLNRNLKEERKALEGSSDEDGA